MRSVLLATTILFIAGCGQANIAPAPTVITTIKGSPAAGLDLRLFSDDGKVVARGATDASGRATLRTEKDEPAPAGTYKVVFMDLGGDEPDPMSARKATAQRIAPALTDVSTTTMKLTIEAGKLEYTLDIK